MNFYSINNKLLCKNYIIYITFFILSIWIVKSCAQENSNLKHENITLDDKNIVLKDSMPTNLSTDILIEHTLNNSNNNNLKLNITIPNIVNISQNIFTTTIRSDNNFNNQTTEKINILSTNITNNKNGNNTLDFTISSQNSDINNTTNTSTTTVVPAEPILPDKGSAEEEHNSSMSIFFVLCVLALGILLIHLMLQTNFQYLPESVVIVFLGGAIGMIINLMSNQNIANWRKEEAFSPTAFFLVLLPPIIFESGYNLHKGNFFQNIGSILVFAIFGTAISAFVIGAGIYLLGLAQVAYKLSFVESFAFGSLISAVDPVATVAIFHALEVDPVLNMLVFGESILNDAISIVLTTSVLESNNATTTSEAIILGLNRFCLMFFASAGIGVVFALISALLLKHVDLRKNPSLEFGLMLVFTYAPYVLAEGIQLSGMKYKFSNSIYFNIIK